MLELDLQLQPFLKQSFFSLEENEKEEGASVASDGERAGRACERRL